MRYVIYGAGGGRIVAEGSPEDVALVTESYTGEFLQGLVKAAAPKARRGRARAGGRKKAVAAA